MSRVCVVVVGGGGVRVGMLRSREGCHLQCEKPLYGGGWYQVNIFHVLFE